MEDTPQTTQQPRVSRLTVARLHNLGNYEHVRYEVTVEIPEGASAAGVLRDLEHILENLDPSPPHKGYELTHAEAVLARPAGELSATERINLELYQRRVAENKAHLHKRMDARDRLDALGGVAVHTDAKNQWDDDIPM